MSVGVVAKFKFVTSAMRTQAFSKYISYMDRDEAIRTEFYHVYTVDQSGDSLAGHLRQENKSHGQSFDTYHQYMSNPEKSTGLFSNESNQLSEAALEKLIDNFKVAQDKDSNMWQIVISFDNDWLEKFGAYDKDTHQVDEEKVMNATRLGMKDVLEKSGMPSAIWSGAIHYNTDNIHVHVAMVELEPSKEKKWFIDKATKARRFERPGYLPYPAINGLKSKVANSIVNRSKEYELFDKLIRKEIGVSGQVQERLRNTFVLNQEFQSLKKAMLADDHLKQNKLHWKYNSSLLNAYRPQIDHLTTQYIALFHQEEYEQLEQLISENADYLKGAYGETEQSKKMQEAYHDKKIGELKTRLGQAVIREILTQDKTERRANFQSHQKNEPTKTNRRSNNFINTAALNRAFKKSWLEIQRDQDYQRLRYEMDNDFDL